MEYPKILPILFCYFNIMSKLSQRVELTANILIIIVAVLLVGVIAQRYFFAKPDASRQAHIEPTIGKQINLPDENFANQPKTLILALQTTCHFCNESAPFYKRLVENVKGKNIKLVAVFPQSVEEGTAHLNELGLAGMEVRRSSLDNIQVGGTPTLILTNDKGEVIDYWVGKLPADKETEVINKLNS